MLQYKKINISMLKKMIKDLKKQYANNYIWLLYGEIGMGKTTFVKHFVNDNITSPSFAGYNIYNNILHIDTYYKNILPIDLIQEYYDKDFNIFIEWPINEELLKYYNCISIHINHDSYFIYEGIKLINI